MGTKAVMNLVSFVIALLVAVALINWGLVAWFDFNLVTWLSFGQVWLEKTIYSIVAVVGTIYVFGLFGISLFKMKK